MAYVYKLVNKITTEYFLGKCNGNYSYNKIFYLKTNVNEIHCPKSMKQDIIDLGRDMFYIEVLLDSDDISALDDIYSQHFKSAYYNRKFRSTSTKPQSKSIQTRTKMSLSKLGKIPSESVVAKRTNGQRARLRKLAILGKSPTNAEYLIFHNGWYYFKYKTQNYINRLLVICIETINRHFKDKVNSGGPLSHKLKYKHVIMYTDPILIHEKLKTIKIVN